MSNAITHISEEPITASICSPLTPTVAPAVNWDAAEAGVAAAQDPERQAEILGAALEAARRGWPVFPLDGKIPLTPHGFHDASDEEVAVRLMFEPYPGATGYGIRTGEGLIVIDGDPQHGGIETLARLAREHGPLEATVEAVAGRGGPHFYFRKPTGVRIPCSAGLLGAGVDVRGDGGYIVGPGSQHPNGNFYRWRNSPDDHQIADCPAWILELLTAPRLPAVADRACGGDRRAPVGEGQRNDFLFGRAGQLRRLGLSSQALHDALRAENRSRCQPPLPDDEVRRIAEGIQRYPEGRVASNGPDIILPSAGYNISESSRNLFQQIGRAESIFSRGGRVMEVLPQDDGTLGLGVLRPEQFRSRIERYGTVKSWKNGGPTGQPVLVPALCSKETAEAFLASMEASEHLPKIIGLTSCPIAVEIDGQLRILAKGYHQHRGGILVTGGQPPPTVALPEAVCAIKELVQDFDFQTPGDRSRGIAAFITPALWMGGFIDGHIPVEIFEANAPRAGKGFGFECKCAIYREVPYIVARRSGGVGGLDESFGAGLILGRPFILWDNLRGLLDSQYLEAFVTAKIIGVRVPYRGEITVDPRHFQILITSNGLATTDDLSERSVIIRIRKRPADYAYHTYPEGDVKQHIVANQPHYLGSIFSVLAAWLAAGKPRTCETRHSFRSWAQPVDWILQNLLGEAPLLDGHQAQQERLGDPTMTWARLVAVAIERDRRFGVPLSASDLSEVCESHDLDIPGLHQATDEARNKRIGALMRQLFGESSTKTLDGYVIQRRETSRHRQDGGGNFAVKTYTFNREVIP